jgi:hypothetical protein
MIRSIFAVFTVVAALGFSAALAASQGNGNGSNASSSGATHGAFADVNGNFGNLTPGAHGGGDIPGATGYNNSHVSVPPTPSPSSNH